MITVKNGGDPLLDKNRTFRCEVAAEDMTKWCEANCHGTWEIVSPDEANFEFPDDAVQFSHYFWQPTVGFDI